MSVSRLALKLGYRVTVFDRQGQLVFEAGPENEKADSSQCSSCHALPSPAGPLPNRTWQGNGQFHAFSTTGLGWNVVVTAPSVVVLGPEQRTAWMVLGLVLLGLASSLVMGDWAGRRLARPILQLAESASRFGAGEEVSPLDVTSRDEVGALTESFNAMVTEISEGRSRQEKQQARLHTLWELDMAMSSTLSLPGVLDIVAEEILRHDSVTGLAIYLMDDAGVLAPVLSRGTARPLVTGRGERRLEDLARETLLAGEPTKRELTARPSSSDLVSAGETIALFVVPLASRGKSLGPSCLVQAAHRASRKTSGSFCTVWVCRRPRPLRTLGPTALNSAGSLIWRQLVRSSRVNVTICKGPRRA
ncbi:MAG: HAMP domain-containing protein [Dehalococcoidia bacterium]|nr:HAMP domain-containing protein [Dehalococcoidia bacterium]